MSLKYRVDSDISLVMLRRIVALHSRTVAASRRHPCIFFVGSSLEEEVAARGARQCDDAAPDSNILIELELTTIGIWKRIGMFV